MNECKFKHTDRTGLYILVLMIWFSVVPTLFFENPATKDDIKKLNNKIDSLITVIKDDTTIYKPQEGNIPKQGKEQDMAHRITILCYKDQLMDFLYSKLDIIILFTNTYININHYIPAIYYFLSVLVNT